MEKKKKRKKSSLVWPAKHMTGTIGVSGKRLCGGLPSRTWQDKEMPWSEILLLLRPPSPKSPIFSLSCKQANKLENPSPVKALREVWEALTGISYPHPLQDKFRGIQQSTVFSSALSLPVSAITTLYIQGRPRMMAWTELWTSSSPPTQIGYNLVNHTCSENILDSTWAACV